MEQLIDVAHVNGAWRLQMNPALEPILFLSGGRAECAARNLARRLAEAGCSARVRIRDMQDVLVGDHCYKRA